MRTWQGATGDPFMFRPGGDITYLPYIRALAEGNLGEPADFATRGEGSWNIPWLLLTPWALALKLFGPWGFLLMDLALQVLRWWLIAGRTASAAAPATAPPS